MIVLLLFCKKQNVSSNYNITHGGIPNKLIRESNSMWLTYLFWVTWRIGCGKLQVCRLNNMK